MIKAIDHTKCLGCGSCVARCPLDALRLNEQGLAIIAYQDDCMTCYLCERGCPAGAIDVEPARGHFPPVFPGKEDQRNDTEL